MAVRQSHAIIFHFFTFEILCCVVSLLAQPTQISSIGIKIFSTAPQAAFRSSLQCWLKWCLCRRSHVYAFVTSQVNWSCNGSFYTFGNPLFIKTGTMLPGIFLHTRLFMIKLKPCFGFPQISNKSPLSEMFVTIDFFAPFCYWTWTINSRYYRLDTQIIFD